jgi:hypothetical protein
MSTAELVGVYTDGVVCQWNGGQLYPANESLPRRDDEPELWFVDLRDYWEKTDAHGLIVDEDLDELC